MDKSKMRQVTVKWLSENVDSWRENALLTNLPRAYINVGTFEPVLHQVVSLIDPLPSWTVGANGLYTVWLANELDEALELEGDYPVFLDDSNLQPVAGWSEELDEAFRDLANELERNNLLEEIKNRPPMHLELDIERDIERELKGKPSRFATDAPAPTVVRTPTEDDLKDWIKGLNLLKAEIVAYDEYDYYCQTSGMDSDERDAYNRQQYNASTRKESLNGLIDKAIKALDAIVSLTPESFNDESEAA